MVRASRDLQSHMGNTLYDTKGIIKEDYEIPSGWVPIAQNSVTNYLTEILRR